MEQSPKLLSNEIRLLNLLPGKWSDPIHCTWQIVSLNGNPKYQALSYVWGRSKHSQPIYLNGSPIHITKHLRRALRQLRSGSEAVCLWVDAVCINQSDDEEKTEQVKMMGKIYAQSQEVVVYLGDAFAPSFSQSFNTPSDMRDAVSHTMTPREYYSMSGSNEMDTGLVWRRPLSHKDGSYLLCFIQLLADGVDMNRFIAGTDQGSLDDVMEALRLFLSAVPWWKRVWVIQEVVIPSKIMILYGSMIAPWETFVKAANCVHENAGKVIPSLAPSDVKFLVEFSRRIRGIESIRNRWQSPEQITLVQLLRQFSGRKATDPRDKVYALLGLAKDKPSVEPNYAAAELDVLADTTLDIISRSGSLDVWAGDFTMKDNHAIPSWIPDWSSPPDTFIQSRIENVKHYNACKNSPVYVQLQSSKEFSTVYEYITRIDSKQEEGDKPDDVIRNWIHTHWPSLTSSPWAAPLRAYQNGHIGREQGLEVIEAYYNTRGGAGFLRHHGEGVVSLPGSTSLGRYLDTLGLDVLGLDPPGLGAQDSYSISIRNSIMQATYRRKFFVTFDGRIGLCPASTKRHDLVCIFPGGRTPFILRRRPTEDTKLRETRHWYPFLKLPSPAYEILGDCYVHKLMDGEAMHIWEDAGSNHNQLNIESQGRLNAHSSNYQGIHEDLLDSIEWKRLINDWYGGAEKWHNAYSVLWKEIRRRKCMLDVTISHRQDIAIRDYENLAQNWEYVKEKYKETWMAWSELFDFGERSLRQATFEECYNNLQAFISGMREWQSSRVRSQGSLQAYMQLFPIGSPEDERRAQRRKEAVRTAERGLRFEEIPLTRSIFIKTEEVRRRLALEHLGPRADKVAMFVLV
ncbi:hypothetical protein APSETT444_004905 [Aspergillus pseudonomiae]